MTTTMKPPDFNKFSEEDTAKMEEITGVPAKAMMVQAGLLPTPPENALVLDNACGGGLVASILFNSIGKTDGARVVCADIASEMVQTATQRIKTNGWNAEATVADAQALPFPDNHFTHNMVNFAIQGMDAVLAAQESFRVLKPGGKLGMTTWVAPGWLPSFQAVIPGFRLPPMFTGGPMSTKEGITDVLTTAGFTNVDVRSLVFDSTDDITRFLRYMREVVFRTVLVGEVGEKYERYMRERYGDGDFSLTWEAVVITAEKP